MLHDKRSVSVTETAARERRSRWVDARWPVGACSPLRWADAYDLGSSRVTGAYWAGVLLVVASFFSTKLLPCVDYPQHLALSDVARRLLDPSAPEHAEYVLNTFTYNGLFHLVVAGLSYWLPVELAGRLVVACSLLGLASAIVALVRVLRRPPSHAALFTPILFSFALGWGFVNYVLATAIAAWCLVFVARGGIRPSWGSTVAVALLGIACAYAHVLAMLILCVASAALATELGWRTSRSDRPGIRVLQAIFRAIVVLLPLAVGCAYCVAVYEHQFDWDPKMYRDPTLEGSAPPIWQKVAFFSAFASDLFGDATDQVMVWVTLAVMAWSAIRAWNDEGAKPNEIDRPPTLVAPFAFLTLAYFATPMVLIGTHLIFPRLGQWAMLGAMLATPPFPAAVEARAHRYILRLGVIVGLNALAHGLLFNWETRDASAMIDDLPPGQAATAVIWDPGTRAFRNGTLTHLAGYYAARKHGRWAFAFARYLSVPVRFKPGSQPPWPAHGWEFDAEEYSPRCRYARAFPLVLLRAPDELVGQEVNEASLRVLVFKGDARKVHLLSHHGRFWAFDTNDIAGDGSL
jgi:hypothetical protein